MNPAIVKMFERLYASREKIDKISLMTNFSAEPKLAKIIGMGWGSQLEILASMHILDDSYNPFKVVRLYQMARRHDVMVKLHCVPSPDVVRFKRAYLDFFSFFGVPIVLSSYNGSRADGSEVGHYEFPEGFEPKSYRSVVHFLEHLAAYEPISTLDSSHFENVLALNENK